MEMSRRPKARSQTLAIRFSMPLRGSIGGPERSSIPPCGELPEAIRQSASREPSVGGDEVVI